MSLYAYSSLYYSVYKIDFNFNGVIWGGLGTKTRLN